ncbi:hypothetical protein, partial [Streptomyces fradiae]|uniref:hypothetical protein n=1 Tax=Streptomyces fradiae TaxID=1906 RepID=UPI0033E42495
NSPDAKADGWSDWTVSPYWSDGARTLRTTIGRAVHRGPLRSPRGCPARTPPGASRRGFDGGAGA